MKKEIKGFIAGVLSVSLLSAGVSYAAGWLENISVVKNSTTISANYQPVNADNFIYNDTTYVPLRAVTESLGCNVMWNEETRDISVNNTPLYNAKIAALALSELELLQSTTELAYSMNNYYSTYLSGSLDGFLNDDSLIKLSNNLQKVRDSALEKRNFFKGDVPLKYFVENNLLTDIDHNAINTIFSNWDKQIDEMTKSLQALSVFDSYDLATKRYVYLTDSNVKTIQDNIISVQSSYYEANNKIKQLRYALFDYIRNL